jgi:MFS family permease
VGEGLNKVALLWFVYQLTGSALMTTMVRLLQTIPPLVFGPLIGVCLDRMPKKKVMIWVDRLPKKGILIGSNVARAVLLGLIPCVVSRQVFSVEVLYVLVFLYGIATGMFVPTLSASVPFLVPGRKYTAANALLQSTTSIGIIMGPAITAGWALRSTARSKCSALTR